jgi:chromosome partitioning protein
MAEIIAIANQKGGVGKTTTTINLGSALHQLGKRVLLVDMDPQGHVAKGLGIETDKLDQVDQKTIAYVFQNKRTIRDIIIEDTSKGFAILPSGISLASVELEMANVIGREYMLQQILSDISKKYDYILIDCPPTLSVLTQNAMAAARHIIVTTMAELYSANGIQKLFKTFNQVRLLINKTLDIDGMVVTMVQGNSALHNQVKATLTKDYGDILFKTVIRRNIALAEAVGIGKSIFEHAPNSAGVDDYIALAKEVINRYEKPISNKKSGGKS